MLFVPVLTSRSESRRLNRRKGGGGGGRSGGGSSAGKPSGPSSSKGGTGGSSSGGKTSAGSTSGKTSTVPLRTPTASGKSSATAYGSGGGKPIVIPAGQPFAGRSAGGGTRSQIFGTRTYGSGYPGITGRGVAAGGAYLDAPEYGNPYNTSRVGGPMTEATFSSNSTNTTFHVLSDNSTVSSLISSIDTNCSSLLSSSSSTSPQVYNASAPDAPQPPQAIQYYRASSIVLTMDGYSNYATLSGNANATDSPLPSGIDVTLLNCLNQTIALSAPLVSSASLRWSTAPYSGPFLGSVLLIWWILQSLL